MLVEHHSMLRSVTITDSEKQGQLCIQDEQLLELRNWFTNKDLEQIFEVVKIPHIFKPNEEPSAGEEDVDEDGGSLAWQYDGEEVFRETVREILVNHKDRMHLVPRGPRDAVL
ncbi:hypothetical protein ACH5RR_003213 [Cinchona calisaya]|uniref:Uncharacterized protein n=1 Tax=Cinchona calisaya TaxID=153742 RepID=A0ABD3AU57_9GENT